MGKVLSGELSCPCERSCFSLKPYVVNPHLNRVVETLTVQKKNVEFHSEKPVEVAHNEPLHLDLHCLLASPWILNTCLIQLGPNSVYTPGIYAAGYIVFALTFVRSSVRMFVRSFVRVFVRSLLSVTFVEFTSKFLVKVSLSEYISLTTHQKAFIFEPWVPERVSFYTMSFCPRVDAPGWG